MQMLLELVEKEGIWLDYVDLSNLRQNIFGLYRIDHDGDPHITLDKSLEHNDRLHRSILAEELGHHFTVPQTSFLVPYTSYSLQRRLSKDEAKALRWACNTLLPYPRFVEAVQNGLRCPHELADYFNVTPWLVWRRFEFMQREGIHLEGIHERI